MEEQIIETKQEAVEPKVTYNDQELTFAEEQNYTFVANPEVVFCISLCKTASLLDLREKMIYVKGKADDIENRYAETKALPLIQFKKGTTKTEEQLNILNSGLCFYERSPIQQFPNFEEQLSNYLEGKPTSEVSIFLEVEAQDILKKLVFSLNKGIKSVIVLAGKYKDLDLWFRIAENIHKEGGKLTIVLPKRMNPYTKESYIKKGIEFKADYIVHGLSFGGGKMAEVMFLDSEDLIYKPVASLRSENTRNRASSIYDINDLYHFSRVSAIDDANTFIAKRAELVI